MHKPSDDIPFRVGSLLLQRVTASAALYRAIHTHWHGYIVQESLPLEDLEKAGTLIVVRSKDDLDTERRLYRFQMKLGSNTRLAYYEVVNVDT